MFFPLKSTKNMSYQVLGTSFNIWVVVFTFKEPHLYVTSDMFDLPSGVLFVSLESHSVFISRYFNVNKNTGR